MILGGRQPARAVEHFRREVELGRANRGLCVLDRDDGQEGAEAFAAVPGLEFFTWPRRHIESYLLVPDAICRSLNGGADSGRAARLLAEHLPAEGTDPERIATDAKRLLDPQGALSQELGLPLSAVGIARAMRPVEIHPEVWELLERARECAGLAPTTRRVGLRE